MLVMKDIKEYLEQKDAIAACFNIDNKTCRISIATESQQHLKEIISNWDEVRQDNSDLHYMFRNIGFLPREEQIHIIQEEITKRNATPLVRAEEQQVARICQEYGASEVWYKNKGDQFRFYITGHLDQGIIEELKQVNKSRQHIYMNPPRSKWTYENGELQTLGAISPLQSEAVVSSGEQLL
jgi:hypothetical protein